MINYKNKYLKYKNKYINYKNIIGGVPTTKEDTSIHTTKEDTSIYATTDLVKDFIKIIFKYLSFYEKTCFTNGTIIFEDIDNILFYLLTFNTSNPFPNNKCINQIKETKQHYSYSHQIHLLNNKNILNIKPKSFDKLKSSHNMQQNTINTILNTNTRLLQQIVSKKLNLNTDTYT
jgi:hypothetical protein